MKFCRYSIHTPAKKVRKLIPHPLTPEFKKRMIMRIKTTAFLFAIACMHVFAEGNAQKVTLSGRNVSIGKVLNEMKKQTGLIFWYDNQILDVRKKVNVSVTNGSVPQVLDLILSNQPLTYTIVEKTVVIRKKEEEAHKNKTSLLIPNESIKLPVSANPRTTTDVAALSNRISEQKAALIDVTGKVTDEKGEGLPGVSIVLKGTQKGTSTDINGDYAISLQPGTAEAVNAVLLFSFVGYQAQEIPLANRTTVNVSMKVDTKSLDELLVVGYGTQKKVNLTGAIDVVKGSSLVNRPTATVSQALQGKVSGVNFSTGSFGFEPGAALGIQIRGQGAPLLLIDNVVGSLNGLNPNDIESISVLKDAAAAAIYGARAPYGVVLITTKSGSQSNKLNVEFSANYSQVKPIRMPHQADSYTTARAMNEASINAGIAGVYTNETIDRIMAYQKDPVNTPETVPSPTNSALWGNVFQSNANYDWFDVYYGKGGRNQQNVSVSGGSKQMNFYLSAGRVFDGGVLQIGKDNYKRYNTIAKFDASLTKWLKVSSNTRYYNTNRLRPAYDNQGDYDLLFHQVARTFPSQYMYSPNGVAAIQSKIPWTKDAGNETTKTNDIVQRFAAEITPIDDLTVNADYTYQLTSDEFISNNFTVYEDNVAGAPIISGSTSPAHVKRSQNLYLYNTFNLFATYKKDIRDKHHFLVMGGYQQERSKLSYLFARKNDLVSQEVPSLSTSTGVIDASDAVSTYATQGFFTRLTYNFKNKYLFEFNSRYDGTYKFAADKRWGFFPSISAGWNVSEEKFWAPIENVVNQFKIRGSWGNLGNQLSAAAYQDLSLMGVSSNLNWILNGRRPGYVLAPGLVNQNITWETSATKNLGLDFGLLKNRLTITTEIYNRTTYDQLGPTEALPGVLGATLPSSNNMETSTKGWELSATWNDRIGKDFSYSVTGMMFDYLTKIKKYNNPTKLLGNPYVGQIQGEIWGLESSGLIQTQEQANQINTSGSQKAVSGQVWKTGDMSYTDLNGDGVITYGTNTVDNPGDRKIIGNNTPRYQFGLTLSAKWKGFDFSMFWQGTAKRDFALSDNMFYGFTSSVQSSIFPGHLNYYRDAEATTYAGLGVNKDAYFARPYTDAAMNAKNQVTQSRYLQSGTFARLKNLQVGYTLPASLLERLKLQQIYLYVSGENLATITKLPDHLDPETAAVGVRGNGKSYFAQQALTFGLNLKF